MKLKYETVLVWSDDKKHIIPFYKYNKGIGLIPAEISFVYRKKTYSTIQVMTLLQNKIVKGQFKVSDWYNTETMVFNKKLFVKLYLDFGSCHDLIRVI